MLPILLLGIGWLVGCTTGPPHAETPSGAHTSATDPEMCAEHGVLEAVCTKCNPALIPVFQAKGDWCHDHDFPASFCPICRPEQGGRPIVDLGVDGSPPDGIEVRFRTRDAAARAGIETVPAVAGPWVGGTEAVARLAWDATRVALVSPRAPGLVTALHADVGTLVDSGSSLASLRSAHVGGDRSRVTAARTSVEVADALLTRKRALREAGITSEREVLEAEDALAAARAELGVIEAEVRLVGGGAGDSYAVTSPIAGVVIERRASVGQSVDPTDPLFVVVDPSRMWAELDVAETDLGRVAVGQPVALTFDALPGRTFATTLAYLAPAVDPRTRTAQGRAVLDNTDGSLRAQMYGAARIATEASEAVVTVPPAAVQRAGDVHLVFVQVADDRFVGRRVRVLARGDVVRIAGPIAAGDPVVTTGSFLLKTETLADSIGAGCCDVE